MNILFERALNLFLFLGDQGLAWHVAQAIGFVGLIFNLLHYQAKTRSRLLKLQMAAGAIFTIHFVILGLSGIGIAALSGAVMSFLVVLRNGVFERKGRVNWASKEYWLYIFLIVPFVIGLIFSWSIGLVASLLPAAVLLSSYARWKDEEYLIRRMSLPASALWLTYHVIVGSIPGTIMESLTLISLIIAMLRLDLKLFGQNRL
jgi:hypothetical protein